MRFLINFLILCFANKILNSVTCQPLIDCYPESNANETNCITRGCVWNSTNPLVDDGAPSCTYPDGYGYEIKENAIDTSLGYILTLNRKDQPSIYGNDVDTLFLSVELWDENILRLKFYDPSVARYEVPIEISQPSSKATDPNYVVTYTNTPQFGIIVSRKSTGATVFNTSFPGLVFSDQYLTISTAFPSATVYGFGENVHSRLLHDLQWETWTMFTLENSPLDSYNLYGVQPFYMNVEEDGNANGVFLLNSNALEIKLQPSRVLTYWTIGGILDFYIFLGPTPGNVVQQFTQLIGHPYMPPYWGLGFQLSRWGYKNTTEIQTIVQNMRDANIPYDVQYSDIDYMDRRKDFTLSAENYADLPELIRDIHDHGQHYVVILDPAIASFDPNYYAYQQGLSYDIFIKYANGSIYEGVVWPGRSFYPDFSHNNALSFWQEQCSYLFHNLSVEYDGLWIDMNEPANFVTGPCEHNNFNYPPFAPAIRGSNDGKITDATICMDTVQNHNQLHYNVHSLYGYFMIKTTFYSLLNTFPQRRPFLFSRSQYSGSGRYGHHWLGDNASTFEQLRNSIIGIQEYNMFGIPFVGADICGFQQDTYEELCMRWMQLGAFYPFSRNHNSNIYIPQDPPSLGPRVVNASIKALTERYRLLPYLYTLLYEAHTSGSTVIRPLFHEFPSDASTWNISFQFMWGSGLMVSPVVYEGADAVDAYFPQAKWYDYYNGSSISGGKNTLNALLDGYIPLHVRGGVIIPTQQPSTTTTANRSNPMGVIVALDEQETAKGQLYWDDGITYDADVKGLYNIIQYSMDNNILNVIILNNGLEMSVALETVIVYGQETSVTSVNVDGTVLNQAQIDYNADLKVLTLSQLGLLLPFSHQIQLFTS